MGKGGLSTRRNWAARVPAVVTCSADGVVTFANEAAHIMLRGGAPNKPNELVGSPFELLGFQRLFHGTNRSELAREQCPVRRALRGGERCPPTPFKGACRVDGELSTIVAEVNPIRDPDGRIVGAVGVLCKAVRRRAAAEAALQRRMQQHTAIARLAHRAIQGSGGGREDADVDNVAGLMRAAAAAVVSGLRLKCGLALRLEPETDALLVRGATGWRFPLKPPAAIPVAPQTLQSWALQHSGPVLCPDLAAETRFAIPEALLQPQLRSAIAVSIGGGPRRRAHGMVLGLHDEPRRFGRADQSFIRSVAGILAAALERRHAMQAVRESEGRFRRVLRDAPIPMMVYTYAGEVLQLNRAWTDVTGFSSGDVATVEEWAGAAFRGYTARAAAFIKLLYGTSATAGRNEFEGWAKNGQPRSLLCTAWPLGRLGGSPQLGVVAALDITERRQMEGEMLNISDRERERIGQDLHDDLCQQLNAIQFMVRMAEHQLEGPAPETASKVGEIAEHLRRAAENARRLARGFLPVSAEALGLVPSLREVLNMLSQAYGVRCELQASAALPTLPPDIATHVYRIAQEATSNAIKHGKATWVKVRLRPIAGHRAELRIQDNGCGLPPDHAVRAGLGMRIMRQRVRVAGGILWFARRPGGGTEVLVIVPTELAAEPDGASHVETIRETDNLNG